jgi:CTP:molybdopterin cytidylyltransferase MocA
MFDAILPAGGRISGDFATAAGTEVKALIQLDDRTILGRTIDVLRGSGCIGKIAITGPNLVIEGPDSKRADVLVAEGSTGPENIFRAFEALKPSTEQVLVVMTDQPFLEADHIKDFLDRCDLSLDLNAPLIRQSAFIERFPNMPATFVKLKDDAWTTGGIFLIKASTLARVRPDIERVFDQRKSKLGMAKLLGLPFVIRWISGRATSDEAIERVTSILKCTGQAVRDCAPELAFDIDLPEDLRLARESVSA